MVRVLITGATGFVGGHLVKELVKRGHEVTVLVHKHPNTSKGVALAKGDIHDSDSLEHACEKQDVVVHLVGIIQEKGDATFERTHVEGTKNMVKAAKAAGVKHFLYVSALGATPHSKSRYQLTKYEAELIVKQSNIPYTIFRPSIILGPEDKFANLLAGIVRVSPVIPMPPLFSRARIQPVYVDDLIACIVASLEKKARNIIHEVAGPEVLTLQEFFDLVITVLGVKRLKIPIPDVLFHGTTPLLRLFGLPLSKEQLTMLEESNVCDHTKIEKAFSLKLIPPGKALKGYLR